MGEETLEIFKRGTKILNILQDEKRQQILILLCREKQLTVNEITALLPISMSCCFSSFKVNVDAGLLSVTQTGLERYYSSDLDDTLEWLKELTNSLEANLKK